jgi:hypothetical protein
MPTQSTETWKAENPWIGFGLWSNERKTGSRLLHAERRKGSKDTTSIREKTPAGWLRIFNG